jgi:hypothetical protein
MRDHCTLDAPLCGEGECRSARGLTAAGRRSWFAVLKRIVLGGLLALAAPTMVLAQSETYFDRNNNVSVLDRPRPDYQALGIVVGGMVIYPSVTASTQYNDNILASSDPIGDLIESLTPTVEVNSNWSRNAVKLTATATSNFYDSHPSQNTTDYQFSGAGRLDILTQSNVTAGFSVGQFAVPRSSEDNFSGALTPVVYDGYNANLGALQTLNRVQFIEGFTFSRTAYDNNVDVNGAPLLFDQLDNDALGFSAKVNYAIDPAIAAFVAVTGNDRLYDDTATTGGLLDRDSSGFETTIGLDFDITRLVRGQVQFGYLDQSYVSHAFTPSPARPSTPRSNISRPDWTRSPFILIEASSTLSIRRRSAICSHRSGSSWTMSCCAISSSPGAPATRRTPSPACRETTIASPPPFAAHISSIVTSA